MEQASHTDKIFFNYATVSPISELAKRAVVDFTDEFDVVKPPEVLYKYDPYSDKIAEQAARLINADPEEVVCIKNTTEGVFIASETLPIGPGDEVLVMANEYPANFLPWLKKRKDGVDVTVIPGTDNAGAYQDLLSSISDKTKTIAISSGQYYDGYMPDLKQLSQICQDRGIFLVVDAVQTTGIRKFDVNETPVDFLISGGQKFLRAGMNGAGFMYVSNRVIPLLKDFKVGIRSMESFDENGYTLRKNARRFDDGTQNLAGIVTLNATLSHINEIGIEKVEQDNKAKLTAVKACLTEHGIPFIDHGDQQSNIVSMKVPDPKALFEYLKDQNIYIKYIKDIARVSFVADSSIDELQVLAKATRDWLNNNQ